MRIAVVTIDDAVVGLNTGSFAYFTENKTERAVAKLDIDLNTVM